jgi:hypothetical protein
VGKWYLVAAEFDSDVASYLGTLGDEKLFDLNLSMRSRIRRFARAYEKKRDLDDLLFLKEERVSSRTRRIFQTDS